LLFSNQKVGQFAQRRDLLRRIELSRGCVDDLLCVRAGVLQDTCDDVTNLGGLGRWERSKQGCTLVLQTEGLSRPGTNRRRSSGRDLGLDRVGLGVRGHLRTGCGRAGLGVCRGRRRDDGRRTCAATTGWSSCIGRQREHRWKRLVGELGGPDRLQTGYGGVGRLRVEDVLARRFLGRGRHPVACILQVIGTLRLSLLSDRLGTIGQISRCRSRPFELRILDLACPSGYRSLPSVEVRDGSASARGAYRFAFCLWSMSTV
jgi:hypothetical protein